MNYIGLSARDCWCVLISRDGMKGSPTCVPYGEVMSLFRVMRWRMVIGWCGVQSIRWRHFFRSPRQTNASENCCPVCAPTQRGWGGKISRRVRGVKIIITPPPHFREVRNLSLPFERHRSHHDVITSSFWHQHDAVMASYHHHKVITTSSWCQGDIITTSSWRDLDISVCLGAGVCVGYPGETWRKCVSKQSGGGRQR